MNLPQRARIACDASQRRFADLLGTTQGVISRWESGEATPSAPIRVLLELIVDRHEVSDWLAEKIDAPAHNVE